MRGKRVGLAGRQGLGRSSEKTKREEQSGEGVWGGGFLGLDEREQKKKGSGGKQVL